jgi:3-oxoacyl-[acyl-carrier-protein] synthase-3
MNTYIKAISYYLPGNALTNEQLAAKFPEWTVEKIASKIGVNQRHIAAGNETAVDMGIRVAEKLFSEHEIDRSEIDFLLFCTQSPDCFLPTSACIIAFFGNSFPFFYLLLQYYVLQRY